MKLLLVEDDAALAATTLQFLRRHGFVVDLAGTLQIASAALLDNNYSIVLLDRRLPDGDGTDLILFARRKKIETRFLVLSAVGDLDSRVEGLNLGADDYLVKPFEPDELIARIRAIERRPLLQVERTLKLGRLTFDQDTRNVRIDDETIVFPRRELLVLECLVLNAGRVVTRESLESWTYGYDDEIHSNTLESHVSRLRKKLDSSRADVTLSTIRGIGYMLSDRS